MAYRSIVRSAFAVSVLTASAAFAQQPPAEGDVADLSLEELLNQKVGVATRTAVATRESPGIITIVSREEIEKSGARDLMEILQLVPGFSINHDVESTVSLGFRGVWGHEGKILLLLDGQEMNENLYSSLQLGQNYLADTIERVEIIRGPGSAIYGGYAELAVINVVSRSAAEGEGISVRLTGAKMSARSTPDGSAAISAAKKLMDGDLEISFNASAGRAQRSGNTYTSFAGTKYDADGNSRTHELNLNLGIKYKMVRARILYDNYRSDTRDGFGEPLLNAVPINFPVLFVDVQADWKPLGWITVTPRLNLKTAQPWASPTVSEISYHKQTDRYLGSLIASLDPVEGVNVLAGIVGYIDTARVLDDVEKGVQTDFRGRDNVSYANFAAFGQALWQNPIVNVTAGARYENHSAFGPSFVPRVGLTRVIDRIHLKALYSGAFRAPGIENINLGLDVKPERTWVAEAEVGYQFTDNVFARVNVFDINVYRPIIYSFDPVTLEEGYQNFPRTGTRGFETEVRTRFDKLSAVATYSFYETDDRQQVPSFEVPGRRDLTVGQPQHKITLNGSFDLTDTLSINPSGTYLLNRYAYLTGDADGAGVIGQYPDTLLLNLFFNMRDLGMKGLNAGVGVTNLLNEENAFLQAYNGGVAPLPGPGRTFVVRVGYALPL